MLTLGIETSCDETSAAVVRDGREVLSNVIYSQTDHSKFGGVVPEVAGRAHLLKIVPIYREALDEAGTTIGDLDLIAATMGPGLIGPLLVGLTFAKGLAFATGKPFVAVDHMEGHLAANLIEHPELNQRHLTLIVSGGHTMLVEVSGFGSYELLGSTKDDAAGEAFDKVAKLLGLGYPGGARLEKLAASGDSAFIRFPRPVMKEPGYQFSYSGLKTAVAVYIKKLSESEFEKQRADIAASFQEAAVEVLVEKTVRAARDRQIEHVTLSGGVAANSKLRGLLKGKLERDGRRLFYPSTRLCTDNGAMIASAGYFRYLETGASEMAISAIPYLKLGA